ncbi:MAG: electron transfer flavoprotein subunit alpha/FixB family protein [Bacillota bacterium]
MGANEYNGILVVAEQQRSEIHKVSYELIYKAKELSQKLNSPVMSVLIGSKGMSSEELVYRGIDKLYILEDEIFEKPNEIIYKNNLVKIIKEIKPEIVLFGATTFGRSLAPRVSAALNTGLTADCTELDVDEEGKLIQIRPAFSENILAHIKTSTYPQMATVRYQEFQEAERNSNRTAEIIQKEPVLKETNFIDILSMEKEQTVNISEAEVIVAGGNGLKNPEDINLLQQLADKLGGSVAASRKIVDEGFIAKEYQVGYSGNRVKPRLYFAFGISGAPQHIAGMKKSDIIIAINTDASAPIFEIADYGIIGDLYEVIPQFINLIEEKNKLASSS